MLSTVQLRSVVTHGQLSGCGDVSSFQLKYWCFSVLRCFYCTSSFKNTAQLLNLKWLRMKDRQAPDSGSLTFARTIWSKYYSSCPTRWASKLNSLYFSLWHYLAPTLVGDISDLGHFWLKQTVPVEDLRHPVKWLSSNTRFLPIFSPQIDTSWAWAYLLQQRFVQTNK